MKEKFPTNKPLSSVEAKFPCVNLIPYVDDFIITGRTNELLEGEIKPLVEQFLLERGLELSPGKTVITCNIVGYAANQLVELRLRPGELTILRGQFRSL